MNKFQCFDCTLSITRKQIVLPEIVGDNPLIAFQGMGPGPEEDKIGRPFIGSAGNLLRVSLKTIGLKNYQLINSTLCFLPKNNEPSAYQAERCSHHWPTMIAPSVQIVVALGRVALRCAQARFGDQVSIVKNRGKLLYSPLFRLPFVATFHPSYLLRQDLGIHDFHQFLNDIKFAISLCA